MKRISRAEVVKILTDVLKAKNYPLNYLNLLCEHIFEKQCHSLNNSPITDDELTLLNLAIQKLKDDYPVEYIARCAEFMGFRFVVNECVHIPKPLTERLVEDVIEFIKTGKLAPYAKFYGVENFPPDVTASATVIDIGTGSGNIILSIFKLLKSYKLGDGFRFIATDISKTALATAALNALRFNIKFNFIYTARGARASDNSEGRSSGSHHLKGLDSTGLDTGSLWCRRLDKEASLEEILSLMCRLRDNFKICGNLEALKQRCAKLQEVRRGSAPYTADRTGFSSSLLILYDVFPLDMVDMIDADWVIVVTNPPYIKADRFEHLPEDVKKQPYISLVPQPGFYEKFDGFIKKLVRRGKKVVVFSESELIRAVGQNA